jgi:hypothetical protein
MVAKLLLLYVFCGLMVTAPSAVVAFSKKDEDGKPSAQRTLESAHGKLRLGFTPTMLTILAWWVLVWPYFLWVTIRFITRRHPR